MVLKAFGRVEAGWQRWWMSQAKFEVVLSSWLRFASVLTWKSNHWLNMTKSMFCFTLPVLPPSIPVTTRIDVAQRIIQKTPGNDDISISGPQIYSSWTTWCIGSNRQWICLSKWILIWYELPWLRMVAIVMFLYFQAFADSWEVTKTLEYIPYSHTQFFFLEKYTVLCLYIDAFNTLHRLTGP